MPRMVRLPADMKGGETEMADKKKCKVVVKHTSGDDCEFEIADCSEGEDGARVIVVRCDEKASDCCCPKK
jgi:hypothetical protein